MKNKYFMIGLMTTMFFLFFINIAIATTSVMEVKTNIHVQYVDANQTAIRLQIQNRDLQGNLAYQTFAQISPSELTGTGKILPLNFQYLLNETTWCIKTQNQIEQHEGMLNSMDSLLGVCNDAVKQYNVTTNTMKTLSEAQQKVVEYEALWNVEKNKRELFEASSTKYQSELDVVKKERDQLSNAANLASQRLTELTKCQEDLEQAEKSKTNQLILGIILGGGAGYFFWGKNKNKNNVGGSMPSEMEEAYEY